LTRPNNFNRHRELQRCAGSAAAGHRGSDRADTYRENIMEKRRVLLVDDVQLFLEQEKTFFNRDDFQLLLARSGQEALRIVREEKPELVFMDLYMPDMDGDRCCHTIKADKGLRDIPIIMVTAGADEEDFERCWQAGCDDIITKPINRHYFTAIIRKYLPMPLRKAPRFIARLRVHFGPDPQQLLTEYSVNVSTGGLFIETLNLLPLGTPLTIEFILPEQDRIIRSEGKVAWLNHPELMRNPNLPVGMGLQFLNIAFDDMNAIREFIKREALLPSW
jgi:uncharacterized protein (TIGR02266 family)